MCICGLSILVRTKVTRSFNEILHVSFVSIDKFECNLLEPVQSLSAVTSRLTFSEVKCCNLPGVNPLFLCSCLANFRSRPRLQKALS